MQSDEITTLLGQAVTGLKNDFRSGARQMASSALSTLATVFETASLSAKSRDELWTTAVFAAKALSDARPSMNAAVTSCLLRVLDATRTSWEIAEKNRKSSVADLVSVARNEIKRALENRTHVGETLNKNFEKLVLRYAEESNNTLIIATLSNSSTIRSTITHLASLPSLSLTLHILESRPRCEGADMVAQILSSLPNSSRSRVRVRIFPDCAASAAMRDAQFVLLGADRIKASGAVSNKIGSFILAVMARVRETKVVVLSDVDKIVAPEVEGEEEEVEVHPPEEMTGAWAEGSREALREYVEAGSVDVFGEWFEWVPAEYIDVYVTENGELTRDNVEKFGQRIGELKEKIFGAVTADGAE